MKLQPGEGERFVTRYRIVLERQRTGRGRRYRYHPERVVDWLTSFIAPYDRRILGALYVDAGLDLFGHHVTYVGTRYGLVAEPRGVFLPALLAGAYGLVVFQNHLLWRHPAPSADDLWLHYQIRQAGELLGICVLDYLILDAEGRFVRLSLSCGRAGC